MYSQLLWINIENEILTTRVDYSMLSKTNVHHFAGNNVSQPPDDRLSFLLDRDIDIIVPLAQRRSL